MSMRNFSNSYVTLSVKDVNVFSDNKYIMTVTRNNASAYSIRIDNTNSIIRIIDNNPFDVDITDLIRATPIYYVNGSPVSFIAVNITTLDSSGNTIGTTITFSSSIFSGFYTNDDIFPLKKYYLCNEDDTQPIVLKLPYDWKIQNSTNGTWEDLYSGLANIMFIRMLPIGFYRIVPSDGDDDYYFDILKAEDCRFNNSLPVSWIGENGQPKKWIFEVTNHIRRTNDSIELYRNDDGYTVLKGKQLQIQVIEKQADIDLRNYLSDLVYSSSMSTFYYDNEDNEITVPITVSDSSSNVSIDTKYADISMLFSVQQHSAI